MTEIEKNNTNPVVTLRAQAEKFDYKALKAEKSNAKTNSGEEMYKDFIRMRFVINNEIIDEEFVIQLCDKHNNLSLNNKDKDYRILAKQIFTEMFEHAGAHVPSDLILEELITHCNPSGFAGSLIGDESKPLSNVTFKHGLSFRSINYTIHINCNDTNCATVRVEEPISVCAIANPQEEMCKLDSLLELTLESQNDKKDVTYKDGKLLLTVPKELKNYKAGDKNLFDVMKEYFQKLCEKLGFKFETKIEHDLDAPLSNIKEVKQPTNGVSTTKWYVD